MISTSSGRIALRFFNLAIFLGPAIAVWACAQDARGADLSIEKVEVGFAGAFKVGKWTPLAVTVEAARPMNVQMDVEAVDPDGHRTILPGSETELSAAGRHVIYGLFKYGRLEGPLRIRINEGAQPLAEKQLRFSSRTESASPPALEQSGFLLATLGKPAGFSGSELLHVAELDDFRQLPLSVSAYDTLDVLVVAGRYDIDPERSRAVREWVLLGGHLIVSVGSEIDSYRASPLADWMPVRVLAEPSRLPELSGMESYANTKSRIRMSGRLKAARLRSREGEDVVSGLDGPLLIRVPYGFGKVSVLGVDLDRPPLSSWEAVSRVGQRLVVGDLENIAANSDSPRRQLGHSGISDLATQLHAVQEDFPQVARVSVWTVMGLLLVYLLVIGPLDYLFVHRVLKKPHLTWITFPLIVTAAAALSAWGASAANGDRLRMNQLDVIDIDSASHTTRAKTWTTIYSPQSRRYRVEVEVAQLAAGNPAAGVQPPDSVRDRPLPRVAWSGVPENAYGGMYRPAGFEVAKPAYLFSEHASGVENLPIAIWSTKSLSSTWHHNSTPLVESDLESPGYGRISGTISHRLAVPIKDWILAYAHTAYRPAITRYNQGEPVLRPFQRWSPSGPNVSQRELNGFLTGAFKRSFRREGQVGEIIDVEKTPYHRLSRNPDEIVRMLTFHQQAGGTEYTGLENNALRALDLSELIDLDRAVLFGRLDAAPTHVLLDGQRVEPDNRAAYVRIVLPVKRVGENRRELPEFDETQANADQKLQK